MMGMDDEKNPGKSVMSVRINDDVDDDDNIVCILFIIILLP